jgi:RimJ/RimL family protein N-acetyltransferase
VIAVGGTDQPAGLINPQFHDDDVTTIAYRVFPAHRGQGIAPRAVRPVAEWAFDELGITAPANAANTASIPVAEMYDVQRIGSSRTNGCRSWPGHHHRLCPAETMTRPS